MLLLSSISMLSLATNMSPNFEYFHVGHNVTNVSPNFDLFHVVLNITNVANNFDFSLCCPQY